MQRKIAAILAATALTCAGPLMAAPPPVSAPRPVTPAHAPNVLLVMTDDVGFGASSTFGGPIPTPTFDALARQGLRYNQFHTTAMCSSTRAGLLTGRNHHMVGTGTVVDLAVGEPGYNSIIPRSAATIGTVLHGAGYSTAWLGKNHNTPDWELTAQGPFDQWPTHLGFDYFFGFMGGAADQNHPPLVENTHVVEVPPKSDYVLDRDLADHALSWLRQQHELTPNKPFFLYLAPGTAHSPHRAPADWIARFKGQFDQGWDRLREETFARQKQLGVIPADTVLTPAMPGIPKWDTLSPEEKRVAARMMEVYAAQLAYFDDQLARVIQQLKQSGQYDNTLILYIQGDNGASGEGGIHGTLSDTINPMPADMAFMTAQLADFGGPKTFENYPVGFAWAMDTPFQYTKQIASHLGGTRNGMVISWPAGIADHGGLRSQYAHVVDVAPTIYQAAGITPPASADGVPQMPLEGVSMAYTFQHPEAPSQHHRQYYEMVGNQGWYEDGWLANTRPGKLPWVQGPAPEPEAYRWELYDLRKDYAQSRDLAASDPKRLAAMKAHFLAYAKSHQVMPLQNNLVARMDDRLRPYVSNGRSHFTFTPRDTRIPDQSFPNVKNRSWSIRASLAVPAAGGEGAIIDQGGWFGGWGLYIRKGLPVFVYKTSIAQTASQIAATVPLTPGKHDIGVAIHADSAMPGAGAQVELSVDGQVVARGHLPATVPLHIVEEGVGIGRDVGTGPLAVDAAPDAFDGTIERVEIDLAPG